MNFSVQLRNNLSVLYEYTLLSLINKEADWPIARRDKVRQDNQTEDTGMKKDGAGELPADTEEARWWASVMRKDTKSRGKA